MDLKEKQEGGITLVTTIRDNVEGYTKKQVKGAIKARRFQVMLGHPSWKDYESMVHAILIANCPAKFNHFIADLYQRELGASSNNCN